MYFKICKLFFVAILAILSISAAGAGVKVVRDQTSVCVSGTAGVWTFDLTHGGMLSWIGIPGGESVNVSQTDRVYFGSKAYTLTNNHTPIVHIIDGNRPKIVVTSAFLDDNGVPPTESCKVTYRYQFSQDATSVRVDIEATKSTYTSIHLDLLEFHFSPGNGFEKILFGYPKTEALLSQKLQDNRIANYGRWWSQQTFAGLTGPKLSLLSVHPPALALHHQEQPDVFSAGDGADSPGLMLRNCYVETGWNSPKLTREGYVLCIAKPNMTIDEVSALADSISSELKPGVNEFDLPAVLSTRLKSETSILRKRSIALSTFNKWRIDKELRRAAMDLDRLRTTGNKIVWTKEFETDINQARNLINQTDTVNGLFACKSDGSCVIGDRNTIAAIRRTGTKVSILSIYDTRSRKEFCNPESGIPLGQITVSDEKDQRKTISTDDLVCTNCKLTKRNGIASIYLEWQGIVPGVGKTCINGTLSIRDGEDKIRFHSSARVIGNKYGLRSIEFPQIPVYPPDELDAQARTYLFWPRGNGAMLLDPFHSNYFKEREPGGPWHQIGSMCYPDTQMCMQFLGLCTDRSGPLFYLAAEDPNNRPKIFQVEHREDKSGLRSLAFRVIDYANNTGKTRRWMTPYDVVISPGTGDWFDAAVKYRNWAGDQSWTRETHERLDKGTPEWFKRCSIWVKPDLGADDPVTMDALRAVSNIFPGQDVAFHWYNWHGCQFDDDYPDYFPPRAGEAAFIKLVAELKAHKLHAVPYIQGEAVDCCSDMYEREQLYKGAVRDMGKPAPRMTDFPGAKSVLVGMCQGTKIWHDKLMEISDRLFSYGVDGIYFDSNTGGGACYAPDHGHTPGYGYFFDQGRNKTLRDIRKMAWDKYKRKVVLVPECFGEPNVGVYDGFLVYQSGSGITPVIPLIDAVYGDVCARFGQYRADNAWELFGRTEGGWSFYHLVGSHFTWGRQLGWYHPTVRDVGWYNAAGLESFRLKLASARLTAHQYLIEGKMMRAPVIDTSLPMVTSNWGLGDVTDKVVIASAWHAKDNSAALVFVNVSSKQHTITARFRPKELGLHDGSVNAAPVVANKEVKQILKSAKDGYVHINLTIPAHEPVIIKLVDA